MEIALSFHQPSLPLPFFGNCLCLKCEPCNNFRTSREVSSKGTTYSSLLSSSSSSSRPPPPPPPPPFSSPHPTYKYLACWLTDLRWLIAALKWQICAAWFSSYITSEFLKLWCKLWQTAYAIRCVIDEASTGICCCKGSMLHLAIRMMCRKNPRGRCSLNRRYWVTSVHRISSAVELHQWHVIELCPRW